jgi:hypothetical protein
MTEDRETPAQPSARQTEYAGLFQRLSALTAQETSKRFGREVEPDGMDFANTLEMGRATARAELTAISRVLVEVLQVDRDLWMRYLNLELQRQVEELEDELGVTGYDEHGKPLIPASPRLGAQEPG